MSDMHSDTVVQTPGHAEPSFSTKIIWRTFWILSIITVVELALAILYYKTNFLPVHWLKRFLLLQNLCI